MWKSTTNSFENIIKNAKQDYYCKIYYLHCSHYRESNQKSNGASNIIQHINKFCRAVFSNQKNMWITFITVEMYSYES